MKKHAAFLWVLAFSTGCLHKACDIDLSGCGPGEVGVKGEYRFVGQHTYDDQLGFSVHPIALGGTQLITVSAVDNKSAPVGSIVATGGLSATNGTSSTTVTGVAKGGGQLQLFSADHKLIDYLAIDVASAYVIEPLYGKVSTRPAAILAGTAIGMNVSLEDGGIGVVDNSLQVKVTGGTSTKSQWYQHTITAAKANTSIEEMIVSITSGQKVKPIEFKIVTKADSLAATGDEPLVAGNLPSKSIRFCPYAIADGREVLGGSNPSVTATGAVKKDVDPTALGSSCVLLVPEGQGIGKVTLSLGALERVYQFTVGNPDPSIDFSAVPEDMASPGDLSQAD